MNSKRRASLLQGKLFLPVSWGGINVVAAPSTHHNPGEETDVRHDYSSVLGLLRGSPPPAGGKC